ncbi:hypothetical protein VII00023_20722 [Vibrio ichthyoenteri ATCC 700023]|uniref:Uncharacterized protein n=1 Tax=Vibrio ichthyoenteri ATCC 700023 TaxID=870968 RepID=F9S7V7_9VIBR|nr:DUF5455 family protein [Vibrio ichthyoenteri]EGU31007.1 hypothetical protein VII00023_20722 [Vibrio ichthyoenteri ATCC 700023]
MAVPVVLLPIISSIGNALKIPAIALFLGQLASTVLAWFAVRLSRGLAINLTVLTMIIALAASIALGITLIIEGLSYVSPPGLSQGFSYFVPSNAVPCLSAIFSARIIRWVWQWQFYAITKISG